MGFPVQWKLLALGCRRRGAKSMSRVSIPGRTSHCPMMEGVLINQAAGRCLAGPQGGPFWGFRAGDRLAVSSRVAR